MSPLCWDFTRLLSSLHSLNRRSLHTACVYMPLMNAGAALFFNRSRGGSVRRPPGGCRDPQGTGRLSEAVNRCVQTCPDTIDRRSWNRPIVIRL